MEEIRLVAYDESFLALSWEWLNDPEIKRLTDTGDFTRESQREWFENFKNAHHYKIWGVTCDGTKIGVAGLKGMDDNKAEYFGYIGEKRFWNKGIGKKMMGLVFAYAKSTGISKIWLRVLKDNIAAIKSYLAMGFKEYDENPSSSFMSRELL